MTSSAHTDRGVSTVADVAIALLFISASVVIVGYYVADANRDPTVAERNGATVVDDSSAVDGLSAPRAAIVLSESTVSVTYGLDDVRGEDEFSEPVAANANAYTRTDHGSPLGLLADAAMTNYRLAGEPILAYGEEYEDAVDWAIRHNLLGAERNVYVVAEWEPYDDAAINGTATAGERPPATADVSSTTTTVSSRFDAIDDDVLEAQWSVADSTTADGRTNHNESYAAAGTVIGQAIVDGLFPLEDSQYALERQGLDRELTVYHYRSMAEAIGDYSFRSPDTHPPLVRSEARAEAANRRLLVGQDGGYDITDADALAAWIAADLPRAFSDEFAAIDEQYDGDERTERRLETVLEGLSIDDVTITIQTWHE